MVSPTYRAHCGNAVNFIYPERWISYILDTSEYLSRVDASSFQCCVSIKWGHSSIQFTSEFQNLHRGMWISKPLVIVSPWPLTESGNCMDHVSKSKTHWKPFLQQHVNDIVIWKGSSELSYSETESEHTTTTELMTPAVVFLPWTVNDRHIYQWSQSVSW